MSKRTGVNVEKNLYKRAMIKAANQGIFSFSALVNILLRDYTQVEATLRTDEK